MLTDRTGITWGSAQQLADHLAGGVTESTIRHWAARDGLTAVSFKHPISQRPTTLYRLDEASTIDRDKRHSDRGRPRHSPAMV